MIAKRFITIICATSLSISFVNSARAISTPEIMLATVCSYMAGSCYGYYISNKAQQQFDQAIPLVQTIAALNSSGNTVFAQPFYEALKREILADHGRYCSTWWAWFNPPHDKYYPFLRYKQLIDQYIVRLYICRFFAILSDDAAELRDLHHDLYALRNIIKREYYEFLQEQHTFELEQTLRSLEQRLTHDNTSNS